MESALAELGATANNYQVLAKLATGGMAEGIFLARSAGVGAVQRYVVLKRVLRERATDITFVRMFLEEARLAAQLQHPNIAQVYDAGKLGDSYFFTMEYVHGETVRAMLQRAHELRRSPPLGCVLAIAAGAAAGLHHAHERIGMEGRPLNIVHRDVSPSNLMVSYDGSVKVVDFGVAKTTERAETQSGAVKGKISYLSPEQARGQRLDRRSDLFSLGIVMWEMLAVERLYRRDSDFAAMSAIIHEPPPPPSSRRRDIPAALDGLVLRALAKNPDDRFQNALELAEAIEAVATQTGSTLAPSSLSRFVRELFGTKPEPWVQLQTQPEEPDVITVTSEPIPAELAIPINDPVDRRLAAVKDLSVAPPPGIFTSELPVVGEPQTVTPTEPTPPAEDTVTTTNTIPGAELPTAPRRFDATAPAPPARARSMERGDARPRHRVLLLAGGAIVVLAIVIAIAIAKSSQDLPPPPPSPQRVVVAEAPDAGTDAAVDAALAIAVSVDAAVAEPVVEVDAAIVVAPPPIVRSPKKPPRPKKTDVAALFNARAFNQVVQECIDLPSNDRAICTLAACQINDPTHARRWFGKVTAGARTRVSKQCAALGVKFTRVDCSDPYACEE